MEEGTPRKPYVVTGKFRVSRKHIYNYTLDMFGYSQAERYYDKIGKALSTLTYFYPVYPECRYLVTKSRMYRNIILDAHLIIYRITEERIEVLDIIHSASSIRKIRGVRNIHL
jgi:plasmid stabilization system protein ParE